ncbi:polysaccharide pyruvyl transferase family protein [Paenibacillus donghaensis]|uniref:Polysaccharide pyruvyl transferase domain-containing protein n=1 Tax=Paenibacillus donghaensis TaxID=414771 RepID=A0A2Z2KEK1_9BACL|nr:polysaccharide pyruvyl transferase family protein [Paenibacillus donghaensis]ASA25196.1 hypothetical protein B9T62_33370 [Paenibacillus donghaensis]
MKKLMIYAYTEFNLGDDLFIKVLCERYPDTRFMLIAPGLYKQAFRELKNLKVYASDSIWLRGINFLFRRTGLHSNFTQKFLVDHSDGIVHIGGSIFMQGEHWQEYVQKNEETRNQAKPYYVMGANFGPYTDEEYYSTHKRLFREYADICFREQYSYDLFAGLDNVRLAPDIIFQLKHPQAASGPGDYIVLSVIKPSSKGLNGFDPLYYEKMKEIAMVFIEKGHVVQLMSFCQHEGDQEAIEHILELLPAEYRKQTKSHFYKTDIEAAVAVIAGAQFVVASRFHAMILGWVFNKPVFPVAYSGKMINVMQDAGFDGLYTDFKQLEHLQPQQVYESMRTNGIDVSRQARQAELHFQQLDSYLAPGERGLRYESQTEHS